MARFKIEASKGLFKSSGKTVIMSIRIAMKLSAKMRKKNPKIVFRIFGFFILFSSVY